MQLIVIVATLTFCYFYAHLAASVIDSHSWFIFGLMALFPFVLGYMVGDENDRADYHRLKDWLLQKFGLR